MASAGAVPGLGALGPTVERFDGWADAQLERLRGHPVADRVFTAASALGDFSTIWHLANVVRATTSPATRRQLPVLAVLIGAESLVVNQGIKRLFKRLRPTHSGDERYSVRRPSTSSFPSGHASAAAFSATVLTGWDGARSAPLWWSLAGVVAVSRAYVRIHHASDVVAGLLVGRALGLVARRIAGRGGAWQSWRHG
jgi:undecaprenyl-diphosphatase